MSKYKKQLAKQQWESREWYSIRSILGCDWAMFYCLLGGREVGKSHATADYFLKQWKKYGRPFYWLRLTESSAKKLLCNNAEKLIDPDLRRKYNIEIKTKGDSVYDVSNGQKRLMARVLALNTFYNDKGSGLFDKDFLSDPNMYYNICLDEMNREQSEKRTFDIVYAFANQLENLIRSTKERVRIVMIGNTLQEASDIMCSFNFLPEEFGRYYLRKQRCVIDYMPPGEKYTSRRKGTVADILSGTSSTFTNKTIIDKTRLFKGRLKKPQYIIKFDKDKAHWFVLWDGDIIAPYNGETCTTLSMKAYLNDYFIPERRDFIIENFNTRRLWFKNLMTQKKFQKELELLKPKG